MKAFVTGTAGFIGFHVAQRLLSDGYRVVGYDGVTRYYDPGLKRDRIAILQQNREFVQVEGMLEDAAALHDAYAMSDADIAFHFAAQAGVRYSIEAPQSYVQSNVVGTANLLEALRAKPPRHFIFASSSSVYGSNSKIPFAETDPTDEPLSVYAATKRSGEAMIHSYAHLYGIASTCARFFTVYGPWGRPDMAAIRFATAMRAGRPIDVYGLGKMRRDFTYIDDLVAAVMGLVPCVPEIGRPIGPDSLSSSAPFRTVNVGGGNPVELLAFIRSIERSMGVRAELNLLPMQLGDIAATAADTSLLRVLVRDLPSTALDEGVDRFVAWFRTRG